MTSIMGYTPLEQFLYDSGIAMPGDVRRVARKVEGSDWLAGVIADAKAEALEEAASDTGGYREWLEQRLNTGPPREWYHWLRERAAELRKGGE